MTRAGASEGFFWGGELGEWVRDRDWSQTPLGPVADWPQSLHSTLNLLLSSPQPALLWWGAELIQFYNDAARFMVGEQALGQGAQTCWQEVWQAIGPAAEGVMAGNATQVKDVLLLLDQNGYREERYFDYALSPVLNDQGEVGGIFCICSEATACVLGNRHLKTLRQLSASKVDEISTANVSLTLIDVLSANSHDIPFALLYLLADESQTGSIQVEKNQLESSSTEIDAFARLAASTGIEPGTDAAPTRIKLAQDDQIWPLRRLGQSMQAEVIGDLADTLSGLATDVWHETPAAASVSPLILSGQQQLMGFLVLGISPKRSFDDDYRGFFDLIASQVAHAIADAINYEAERTLHEVRKAANDSERSYELSLQQAQKMPPPRPSSRSAPY